MRKGFCAFTCALLTFQAALAAPWGFLVAGSKTWENYRHQADIAHAYHVLTARGVSPSNIITFMYDDLAQNPQNPFPGAIYNVATGKKPGTNLYKNLKIDYNLGNVTAANVISAMTCDGKVAGRCLRSTADDHVFMYWAGHGDDQDGLILPEGGAHGALGSESLVSALELLHKSGRYKNLVFFLEACDGGSMFSKASDRLATINVLAVTAAKPGEDSYPIYCCNFFKPPSCTVGGTDIGACLGDMFSVAWMTDSEQARRGETLQAQYAKAKSATAPVGGNPGSTVMSYGAVALLKQPISNFEGPSRSGGNATHVNADGEFFDLAHFLEEGRVSPTTPWVQTQEQPGGILFRSANHTRVPWANEFAHSPKRC